jgi:hypothetical protein
MRGSSPSTVAASPEKGACGFVGPDVSTAALWLQGRRFGCAATSARPPRRKRKAAAEAAEFVPREENAGVP